MVELLVGVVSKKMAHHKVINEQNGPVIQYGLLVMIETLLIFSTMFIVSILLGQVLAALAWIGTVFITRSLGGGRHAGTFLQCYFVSVGIFIVCILIERWLESSWIAYLISWGAALLFLICSQLQMRNKPKKEKLKQLSALITGLMLLAYGIILWFQITNGVMLASLLGLIASQQSNFYWRETTSEDGTV